jgi:hypothetical protein
MALRKAIFSDTHGLSNIPILAKAASKLNISGAMHLGDMAYETTSAYTVKQGNMANGIIHKLAVDSVHPESDTLRRDTLEGLVNKEIIKDITSKRDVAIELADKGFEETLRVLKHEFESNGIKFEAVLGGNWDREKPLAEIFGDNYLNGIQKGGKNQDSALKVIDGIKIVGLSGSGSQPQKAMPQGLLADDQLRDSRSYIDGNWKKALLSKDTQSIDLLLTHVPPTDGIGVEKENGVEHIKNLLKARLESGLENPDVLFGHRHGPTHFWYDKEIGTFTGNVGTGGLVHNDGDYSSFSVCEFDDRNKIKFVEEYRVFNLGDGTQEVVHYQNHEFDRVNNKVNKVKVGTTIYHDVALKPTQDVTKHDPNSSFSFVTDYSKLSNKEKHETLVKNLEYGWAIAEKLFEKAKKIGNGARRKVLKGKNKEDYLTLELQKQIADITYEQLFQDTLKENNIDFKKIIKNLEVRDESDIEFAKNIITKNYKGVDRADAHDSFASSKIKIKDINHNYANKFAQMVQKYVSGEYQNAALGGVRAEELQDMAELFMVNNAVRKHDIYNKNESVNLWAQAYQNQIITSRMIQDNENYLIDSNHQSESIDDTVLKELGVDFTQVEKQRLASHYRNEQKDRESSIKDYLASGNPVYDLGLQHVIKGKEGYEIVPKTMQSKLGYNPINLNEKIANNDYSVENGIIKLEDGQGNSYQTPVDEIQQLLQNSQKSRQREQMREEQHQEQRNLSPTGPSNDIRHAA